MNIIELLHAWDKQSDRLAWMMKESEDAMETIEIWIDDKYGLIRKEPPRDDYIPYVDDVLHVGDIQHGSFLLESDEEYHARKAKEREKLEREKARIERELKDFEGGKR